jgi:hypothetical protein
MRRCSCPGNRVGCTWRRRAYHVMSRGHNREVLFADPDDARHFLNLLDRSHRRHGLRLSRAVL